MVGKLLWRIFVWPVIKLYFVTIRLIWLGYFYLADINLEICGWSGLIDLRW